VRYGDGEIDSAGARERGDTADTDTLGIRDTQLDYDYYRLDGWIQLETYELYGYSIQLSAAVVDTVGYSADTVVDLLRAAKLLDLDIDRCRYVQVQAVQVQGQGHSEKRPKDQGYGEIQAEAGCTDVQIQ